MSASPPRGDLHLRHVEALLQEVKRRRAEGARGATPREWFLVRDEGTVFWELVGLHIRGCPSILIGAVKFQRQSGPGAVEFARRPLAYHLSAPPKELGIDRTTRPEWVLEVMLPQASESISEFQARAQGGDDGRILFADTELIDFAFDFRFENPSVEREQGVYQGTAERHLLRSVRGHVLSGISHSLHRRLRQQASFITLRSPVQHTEQGAHVLPPTLVFHRSYIALDAELSEGEEVSDWTEETTPFLISTARSRHILLPDEG